MMKMTPQLWTVVIKEAIKSLNNDQIGSSNYNEQWKIEGDGFWTMIRI